MLTFEIGGQTRSNHPISNVSRLRFAPVGSFLLYSPRGLIIQFVVADFNVIAPASTFASRSPTTSSRLTGP